DPAEDGCSDELAQDVTLSEIAAYQAGKVALMLEGDAFGAGERPVDVVAGKPALFRIAVRLEPSFVERVLSARLTLSDGDQSQRRFHKRTVSGDSQDGTLSSTFNVEVPRERITPETNYAFELVECETAEGSPLDPRFPATGSEPLQARAVGGLKVEFIPILAN